MTHFTSFTFDTEVLAFWYRQALWQRTAFDAYADYLG